MAVLAGGLALCQAERLDIGEQAEQLGVDIPDPAEQGMGLPFGEEPHALTMLATAGTVNKTAEIIMEYEPKQIICASVLSTPVGINNLSKLFTAIVTASEADGLDDRAYICPGVGDSGDRLYG